MKIGYIGGTFDLTHYGHYELFKKCKNLCDYLVVSVNADNFCGRYKRVPILNLEERIRNIKACKWVDDIIINIGDEDSKKTIDAYDRKIDFIFHGDDWTGDALKKQMGLTDDWLKSRNIQMVYVDRTNGISTTDIINRIKS